MSEPDLKPIDAIRESNGGYIVPFVFALLVGPLLFERIWCGWACWYGMIFDMLPYPFSEYRRNRKLSSLRLDPPESTGSSSGSGSATGAESSWRSH